ncbi:hypothetical protein [Paractinoplanes toevensis]|uniref:Uncharacterized protein n=1 Tax=Paractinoplanes toevensis TaxID=571911 RepID=A0A919TAY0_9ACTN|nr:hypothetical protein [Actinoplanes toevensis]GIM92220.1 hypothetical protein Ato02nite_040130 [Actinoplanes toevensis]
MPKLLSEAEVDAFVDHRLIRLFDHEAQENLLRPDEVGHTWLSAGSSSVLLQSPDDIYLARFAFEFWDGPPAPLDVVDWPLSEVIPLFLPSGLLGVEAPTVGGQAEVFDVGEFQHYRVQAGWRAIPWDPNAVDEPQAYAVFQFWVDVAS